MKSLDETVLYQNYIRIFFLVCIVIFYFAIPNARPDFTRFNCDDSESYLALSYSMFHGLGYTRSMIPGSYVGHTTWPPGVPLLMLPAIAASGKNINWFAVKATTITFGIIGIIVAWCLGKRLSGRIVGGDLVALAVALNPFYWDFSHQAMAELPMTVWILGSLLLIDYFWANRKPTTMQIILAGLFSGLGMLFKGHVIALLLAPAAYLEGERASAGDVRQRIKSWGIFFIAFIIPFVCWGVRNHFVNSSGFDGINQVRMVRTVNPTDPDSPLLTVGETLKIVKRNVLTYGIYQIPTQILPFLWIKKAYSWPGSGYLFLILSFSMFLFAAPWKKGQILSLHLVALPIVGLNLIYPFGGAERFWVPISIICCVLLALRVESLMRWRSLRQGFLIVFLFGVMGISLVTYIVDHEKHPYNSGPLYWSEKAELFQKIANMNISSAGVAVTRNSQAFQLMTGIPSPMLADASVDHVIVDVRKTNLTSDSKFEKIIEVYPWALFRLPERLSVHTVNETLKKYSIPD